MKEVNAAYPTLFGQDDEEEAEERKGSAEKNSDSEKPSEAGTDAYTSKWQWVIWVDKVSETLRVDWFKVYSLNVKMFLNIICYSIDKANNEKQAIEDWKRKH